MIGSKLLLPLFVAFCALNVVQISNAEDKREDSNPDSWALGDGTEIPSKASCINQKEISSILPAKIQKNIEAINGIASTGATLNPQSSMDQYDRLLNLLKDMQNNFIAYIQRLKSDIVDGLQYTIFRTSGRIDRSIKDIKSSVQHCSSAYDNRTFTEYKKFLVYNNTPCDPLVDYFQEDIQHKIQAVEQIRNDLKSCRESKFSNKLCESIVVPAAFLAENVIPSTVQRILQQNELFTSMRCCMSFRVIKVSRIFANSLNSFRSCVQRFYPSFDIEDFSVAKINCECERKFTFLNH